MGAPWDDPLFALRLRRKLGLVAGALGILLVLGGVGFGASWVIGKTLWDALRSGDWVRVPAVVQQVEQGEYVYRYEWNGRQYTGDRIGTFAIGGSSEVDDWEPRMERMLSEAAASKRPVMAYVDPEDPRRALLDREVRWLVVLIFVPFAVGFSLAGLVIAGALLLQACGWDAKATGPILKPKVREALTVWITATLWNAICMPMSALALPKMWQEGEWLFLVIMGFFQLLGVLMLWGAVAATWRALREGGLNPFNPGAFDFASGGHP